VFTVSAAAAPGLTEDGLTEHEGVIADAGVTEQVRATEPVNPLTAVTFTVAVEDPPGCTEVGVSVEFESEKSGAAFTVSVNTEDVLARNVESPA
jgi:hypothetical protein